MVAAASFISLA